jgi:hypothetical protein
MSMNSPYSIFKPTMRDVMDYGWGGKGFSDYDGLMCMYGPQGSTFAASQIPFFIGPGILSTHGLGSASAGGLTSGHANGIRLARFVLPAGITVARCSIIGGNVNGIASFAIFSSDGLTKLIDSGTFSANNGQVQTQYSNTFTAVVLKAGVYWFAQCESDSGNGWAVLSQTAGPSSLLRGRAIMGLSPTTCVAGVMPATVSTAVTDDSDATIASALWESA